MKEALKVSMMVTLTISNKGSNKAVAQKALIQYLTHKMDQLKPGEELMIPAGFMKGTTKDILNCFRQDSDGRPKAFGHAIFVTCQKQESGEIEFKIFNAGTGQGAHPKKDGKILPLQYKARLSQNGISKFCTDLVSCSNLPLSNKDPVATFYDCFKEFKPIKQNIFSIGKAKNNAVTQQEINNCTQFCARAFLKSQMGDHPGLFEKFDQFMINDGIKKCEAYLNHAEVDIAKKYLYKHPALKPQNRLHFFLVLVFSKILFNNKISMQSGHVAFEIPKHKLEDFVAKVKHVKAKENSIENDIDNEEFRKLLKKLGQKSMRNTISESMNHFQKW